MNIPSIPLAAASGRADGRIGFVVASIGHLVPRTGFAGRVHSVFARACNVACDGLLLTLADARTGDGPTMLLIAGEPSADLRRLIDCGERVSCDAGRVQTRRSEWLLTGARVWHPAPSRPLLPPARIAARLRRAAARLALHRGAASSVIDRDGASVVAELTAACRDLDRERGAQSVDRLVGWGEGLTPAGDDFLVGLSAALSALAGDDERRQRFHRQLAARLERCERLTTPIAAHSLRLAAHGHYAEPLLGLRDALLAEEREEPAGTALDRALACGATSGADTASGLLAGIDAWLAPTPGAPGCPESAYRGARDEAGPVHAPACSRRAYRVCSAEAVR